MNRTHYKPEIQTLVEGQVICVQGHPAIARNVKIDPECTNAKRICFNAEFLPHPKNEGVKNTAYDGGRYTLYSLYVPPPDEAVRLVAGG